MHNKKPILSLVIGLLCISMYVYVFPEYIPIMSQYVVTKSAITFSNTQTWDSELLANAQAPSPFTEKQQATIRIPTPPQNDSIETETELNTLHEYVSLRTPQKIAEIQSELKLETTVYGTTTFETFINPTIRPYTSELITDLIPKFLTQTVMNQKLVYNRVRPSFLDPSLTTVIDVPKHPSYPSGHAVQSHLIASILSRLCPQNAELYRASADRITKNREIAGLHYPSDSKVGAALASQLLPLLFENAEFSTLFKKAQTEWK